jgi:hypothetical protein
MQPAVKNTKNQKIDTKVDNKKTDTKKVDNKKNDNKKYEKKTFEKKPINNIKAKTDKEKEDEVTTSERDLLGDMLGTEKVKIDTFYPKTKEEFTKFGEILGLKISEYENENIYLTLLKDVIKNSSKNTTPNDIRDLSKFLLKLADERENEIINSKKS